MEVSKLTLTKETKEKMEKPLSSMERGKLTWGKIVEAEKAGRLQRAKDRNDIASIAGYTDKARGYAWVSSLIKQGGAIIETVYAPGEYTYAIGKAPKFEHIGNKTGRKKSAPVENTPVAHTEAITETSRVVIEFGGMRITMENVGVEYAKEIIKTLK